MDRERSRALAVEAALLLVALCVFPVVASSTGSAASGEGWVLLGVSTAPSPRASAAIAYDDRATETFLYGGVTLLLRDTPGETWAYDAIRNAWTDRAADPAPPGQYASSMVYDSTADRIVLFGGAAYGRGWLNETWIYDATLNAWTNVTPVVSPPPRNTFGMAYDPRADRVVVFGGTGTGGVAMLSDTWVYDDHANTWTNVTPAGSPSARTGLMMTYDVAAGRVLLYGGLGEAGDLTDTWAFDTLTRTWTDLRPSGTPYAVRNAAMVYDSAIGRAILFGGRCLSADGVGTTWMYDAAPNLWTRLMTPVTPPCLVQASMAYDSHADISLLFGGAGVGTPLPGGLSNATWAFYAPLPTSPGGAGLDLGLLFAVVLGIGGAVAVGVIAVWFVRRQAPRPPR